MFPSNMEFKFIKPKHAKVKSHGSLSAMMAVTTCPLERSLKKNGQHFVWKARMHRQALISVSSVKLPCMRYI